MPVIELPNGQHAEFPDDMPLDQIKSVIRSKFPPERQENNEEMSQPVTTQPGLLQKAADFAERNINQPIERNVVNPISHAAGGFGQGILNIAPGLYNLGASGINALGGNVPKSPMLDLVPHDTGQKVGEFSSFFAGPGLLKLLGKVPGLAHTAHSAMKIPLIANSIKQASNVLSKSPLATSVAGNALLGGAYSPEHPVLGMTLGGAGPLVGKGLQASYNALKPSKLFRGNLSPEELASNLKLTQGTETGLGDVIGSPFLKRMNENVISKVPFSGANEAMQRTAGEIVNRGHNFLGDLLGKNKAENLEQDLTTALQDAYKSHQTKKNTLYNNVNEMADKTGLKLELPGFADKAKQYHDAIEGTNILKYEPELNSLMNKMKNYKNPVSSSTNVGKIVDKQGNPIISETNNTYPTLKEANLLKGKLNQLANQYRSSPKISDMHAAGVFGNLASELKNDIVSAIEGHGNPMLHNAYKEAEGNYAKNFSPFLDKQIYNFISGKSDPETLISAFIKTGKSNDRSNLIKKVTSKLPPDKRNLLGYGYLQRALDENNVINPLKLKTLLSKNSLGNRQFNALFPDKKMQNSLRNYISLIDKNTKGLKLMQNPDTGQMNMDILPLLSKSPTSFGAKMIGAPIVAKALSSEKVRNNLVNKMIENSKK